MKSQFMFVCLYYTIMIPSWKIKIVRKIHIQPNLLRNWKKEFLANASLAFDNKREDNLREKLAEERKEKAKYAKKVGQLTMQVVWLKKIWRNMDFFIWQPLSTGTVVISLAGMLMTLWMDEARAAA